MYVQDDFVRIRKGCAEAKDLRELAMEEADDDSPVIFHFRWATHGARTPGNSHPFPITDTMTDLKELKLRCKMGAAHNGVLTNFAGKHPYSDSQYFVAELLNPLKSVIADDGVGKFISKKLGGDRLVVLSSNKTYWYWGHWVDRGHVIYSNVNWDTVVVYGGYSGNTYTRHSEGKEGDCSKCKTHSFYLHEGMCWTCYRATKGWDAYDAY